jgi:RES domain
LVIDIQAISVAQINWRNGVRIIRSNFPPIDLFEDIADPADWALLISAEQKTNPRLMESLGSLDLVPVQRRVGGAGASYLMAPFTHVSTDRKSRFGDGSYGVLYIGDCFEVALFETIHHYGRFMAATNQPPGWTSQFRELVLDVDAALHDLRGPSFESLRHTTDYHVSQSLGAALRAKQSQGVIYQSVRHEGGECVGLFYPDLASKPVQGRHLDYHWNGDRVDLYRVAGTGEVFRVLL